MAHKLPAHRMGTNGPARKEGDMSGAEQRNQDEQGIDVTVGVEDHGNKLREPIHHHADAGEGAWRDEEGAETDTPENTGSKVGPGREQEQP